jgi:hypothetical protein
MFNHQRRMTMSKSEENKASETIVKLTNVRLAFPQLFTPKAVNGEGEPAYSASFIIGKDNKAVIEALNKATLKAAEAKWKTKAADMVKKLTLAGKVPLKDGDMKDEYDGYAGNYFVSARSKVKPRVVDRQAQLLNESDGVPYAGCYVIGSISVWAMDNQFGQRINATLRGVQFLRDGDAFSGGRPAGEDEFEEVPGDEGALA